MTVKDRDYVMSLPELPYARPSELSFGGRASPQIAEMTLKSQRKSRKNQAMNGRVLTRSSQAQWYELRLRYTPMRRDQIGPIIAFLEQSEGMHKEFRVPIYPVTGHFGALAGQYVNFNNDSKLHMITATDPAITVRPNQRYSGGKMIYPKSESPNASETIYMVCSLKQDMQTVELNSQGLVRVSLDLIERV